MAVVRVWISVRGHGHIHRGVVRRRECGRVCGGVRCSQRTGDHAVGVTKEASKVLSRTRGVRNRTVKERVRGREEAVARGHDGGAQVDGGEHRRDGVA